jgi:hypothetical protein
MEDKECVYLYYRDGSQFITPSLDHAIERTDEKKLIVKCQDGESREIELK